MYARCRLHLKHIADWTHTSHGRALITVVLVAGADSTTPEEVMLKYAVAGGSQWAAGSQARSRWEPIPRCLDAGRTQAVPSHFMLQPPGRAFRGQGLAAKACEACTATPCLCAPSIVSRHDGTVGHGTSPPRPKAQGTMPARSRGLAAVPCMQSLLVGPRRQ